MGNVLLVSPALALVAAIFLLPMLGFLSEAFRTDEVRAALPHTTTALRQWDRGGLPDDEAFIAVASDLARLADIPAAAIARRLNASEAGLRSLIIRTREAALASPGLTAEGIRMLDPRWNEQRTWSILETETRIATPSFLLAAIDREIAPEGGIARLPPERAIFQVVLGRTFLISLLVTLGCVIIGFPVAYALVTAPDRLAAILILFVLLPFWTSALVRSAAWVVLLQREGLVNQFLLRIGAIDEPAALIFNRIGVLVAMIHVQLPLFVLPLLSVMRRVSPDLMRAAASLGAPPVTAFLQVYLPQVMPGVVAGALLVFTISLGYYITPALVGGPGDQMLSWFVAIYTNQTVNWGMAGALGIILVLSVGVVLGVLSLLQGTDAWKAQ